MSEAAPQVPAAPAATPAPQAPAPQAPAQAAANATWFDGFKSAETKSFIQDRKFTDPEQLAQSYLNLEKLKGVPEDRLLKLPEKMEGAEARAVFERLGAPKEAKGYELQVKDDFGGTKFAEHAQAVFHKHNLTKAQGQNVISELTQFATTERAALAETRKNAMIQADTKLKSEWGPNYDKNVNIAKQGAKILGLDEKSLDIMEALQGRDVLLKNLQKIGVSVGESPFVDGSPAAVQTETPEVAQEEIQKLILDKEFGKKLLSGDTEARKRWDDLNKKASPGDFQIR